MANNSSSRQGHIFDDYSNPDINLSFASYDDIENLCNVIDWAYRGKPSASLPGERYSGWVGEQHLLIGVRITTEELRKLIEDEKNNVILVAKVKTPSGSKIVGCCKISTHDKSLQIGDEEKNDISVDFGLLAVDPDYQSQGIGTLLYNGAMVRSKSSCIYSTEEIILLFCSVLQRNISMHNVFILI
jgi:GNAT superfamily N-acetyltransferase